MISPRLLRSILAVAIVICGGLPLAIADDDTEIRLREIYVPDTQLRELMKNSPDGLVIGLDEYRALVRAALAHRPEPTAPLPPVAATIERGNFRAELRGDRVWVTGTLRISVTREGWVRCPIGGRLPGLATVRIDGEPGWIIAGDETALLLDGKGRHEVTLEQSFPIGDGDPGARWSAHLPPVTAGSLSLSVPGEVAGTLSAGVLETIPNETETTFRVALPSNGKFTLSWQRERRRDATSLTTATHRMSILARSTDPRFTTRTEVTIARRGTDQLRFSIPDSLTLEQVRGPLVHSFQIDGSTLTVDLRAPHLGPVSLAFDGAMRNDGGTLECAPLRLIGAISEDGTISTFGDRDERVRFAGRQGLISLDPSTGNPPREFATPSGGSSSVRSLPLARDRFSRAAAQMFVTTTTDPIVATLHQSWLVEEQLESRRWQGVLEWRMTSGRRNEVSLTLPGGMRLVDFRALDATALRFDEEDVDGVRVLRIRPAQALTPLRPLFAHLTLEPLEPPAALTSPPANAIGGDPTFQRATELALPTPVDANLVRSELGIVMAKPLALEESRLPGWQTLPDPDRARWEESSIAEAIRGRDLRLVTAVRTTEAAPTVAYTVRRLAARGEVRAVTHLLAAERRWDANSDRHAIRVRTDLQLVVLDHALEEVTIEHPALPAETPVHVLGDGIREVFSDAASGRQRVRFARPWTGARQIRIEFEFAATPGTPFSIPEIGLGAGFSGPRFLAIQSQGSVEVSITEGAGLTRAAIDELPDFAEPWPRGRLLASLRHRSRGETGTLTTTVHSRAPVLTQLARTLKLITVLGSDGSSRTFASVVLSSAREQVIEVDLPAGSRLRAVTIDGLPIRAVRDRSAAGPDGFQRVAIPLPPRSHARLTLLTEETAEGGPRSLSALDRWRGQGPRFVGVPVSETRWTVYTPPEWSVRLGAGSNVDARGDRPAPRTFAEEFFGTLLAGEWPRFQTFAPLARGRSAAGISLPLTPEEAEGAQRPAAGTESGLLAPRSASDPFAEAERAVRPQLVPQGVPIEFEKFGGAPEVELVLHHRERTRAPQKFVFFGSLFAFALYSRVRPRKDTLRLMLITLFFATFIPPALTLDSPRFWVPLGEGSVTALLLLALCSVGGGLFHRLVRRRLERRSILESGALPALLLGVFATISVGTVRLDAQTDDQPQLPPPFDTVILPYNPDQPPWVAGSSHEARVYLSHERFQELWRLAHPEESPPPELAVPTRLAIGESIAQVAIDQDQFRVTQSLFVRTFSDESWETLSLPSSAARLEAVRIAGEIVGLTDEGGTRRIPLRGRRTHEVQLDWVGTIAREGGGESLTIPLLRSPAGRIAIVLPETAVLDRNQSTEGWIQNRFAPRSWELVTGDRESCDVAFRYPSLEGDLSAQISSISFTELLAHPDRIEVRRLEQVRATGRPVDRARFAVRGGWQVSAVRGPDLLDWLWLPEGGLDGGPAIELRFRVPISETTVQLEGISPSEERSLPTLTLEGAVRQETYVGLRHGDGSRFEASSLESLPRTSPEEIARDLGLSGLKVDRLHHAHGDGSGATVGLTTARAVTRTEGNAVARILDREAQLFFRVRFTEAEDAPLEMSFPLPSGWTVDHVRAPMLRRFETVASPGGDQLRIEFFRRPQVGEELIFATQQSFQTPPESLDLPYLTAGTAVASERWTWTVVGTPGIDLSTPPQESWEPIPLERAPVWVELPPREPPRFALRSSRNRPTASLTLQITPRASQLRGTITSFAHLGESWLTVQSRLTLDVRFRGRDRFQIELPVEAELVDLRVRDERRRTVTPGTGERGSVITVELVSPVTGTLPIDLVHRLRRPGADAAGERTVAVTTLRLLDPESGQAAPLTSYLGLVQPDRSRSILRRPEGFNPIPWERMPYLPGTIGPESVQGTWHAVRPGASLVLTEEQISVDEGLAALIPLLDLQTRLGSDGTLRTEATIALINERLQFLQVELPVGARLWGVTIDGNPVAVSRGSEAAGSDRRLRIPVDPAIGAQLAREIVLSYEEAPITLPAGSAHTDLAAPKILDDDVPVVETIWSVHFPPGYAVRETRGILRQTPPSVRHAERLRQLIDQQTAVLEATQSLQSQRGRARAAQQLARLEQQLGDSVAGLSTLNRSGGEGTQKAILGDDEVERQWRENDAMLERSQSARKAIRSALAEERDRAGRAHPGDRAFVDRARFLQGNIWQRTSDDRDALRRGGSLSPSALLPAHPTLSWDGFLLLPSDAKSVRVSPQPISREGLTPLPESARLRAATGFPPASEDSGRQTYTFRGASHGELSLTLRRSGSGLRWWCWGVLIVVGGAWFLLRSRPAATHSDR